MKTTGRDFVKCLLCLLTSAPPLPKPGNFSDMLPKANCCLPPPLPNHTLKLSPALVPFLSGAMTPPPPLCNLHLSCIITIGFLFLRHMFSLQGASLPPLLIPTSFPSWSKPPLGHYRQASQSQRHKGHGQAGSVTNTEEPGCVTLRSSQSMS